MKIKTKILYYSIDIILSTIIIIIGFYFIDSIISKKPYGIGETIIAVAFIIIALYFINKKIIDKAKSIDIFEKVKEEKETTEKNETEINEETNDRDIEQQHKYIFVKTDDSWKKSKVYIPETEQYDIYSILPEPPYSDITTWDLYDFFFTMQLFDKDIDHIPIFEFMKRNIIKKNDKDYRFPRFSYIDLPHPNEILEIYNESDKND
jgi:hypothetical protein